MKYSFANDYSEMAHPSVLSALSASGASQHAGYGLDERCAHAAMLIRDKISAPNADVHFVSGGTQANLIIISSLLRPHEAVIAPESGHIFVHETGAIEATGHKICTRKGINGKLSVSDIESVVTEHSDEHMVKPRLVYLSLSTESGTVYTKAELSDIRECCQKHELLLHIDGARLGAAINSPVCDLTYSDVASLTDVFYLGGTKTGALFGEAICICNDALKDEFRFMLKQRGALLAKGFAIGIQFEALFEDGLYDKLALQANLTAKRLSDKICALGYDFLFPVETNIVVPILHNKVVAKLREHYEFHDWRKLGDNTAIRLVTSWATPESAIDEFITWLRCSQLQA